MIFPPIKIFIYILIVTTLFSCASNVNKEYEEFNYNLPSNTITEKIFKEIKSISMKKNIEIIYEKNFNEKESIFIQGFFANFYLNNKYSRISKKILLVDLADKIKSCKNTKANNIRIVLNNNVYEKLIKNCTTEKLNTYLVDLERNNVPISKSTIKIALKDQAFFDNENILNIIKKNKFIYISSEIEEIEKFIKFAKENDFSINKENLIFLKNNDDFELFIAEVFGIQDSSRRNKDLERILNQDLKFISRKRNDIESIILSSNSESSNRLLPALKFNLLMNLEVFNMPNHYDSWNSSSSTTDLDLSTGLEFPILINKLNFGDKSFSSLSSNEKLVYSLGFDMLGFLNDQDYFGFLGQYSMKNNEVNFNPISISFLDGEIFQRF